MAISREEKNKRNRKYMNEHRRLNRDKLLARERKCREKVPIEIRKQRSREYNLLHSHGLSMGDYEDMLKVQNGVCAICEGTNEGHAISERLHVDHNHETGAVRGLLCNRCNQGMIGVDAFPDFCKVAEGYKGVYHSTR